MKKFKLLFGAIALAAVMLSCTDDDSANSPVVGLWTYEKSEALDSENKVVNTNIPYDYTYCQKNTLEFIKNGNVTEKKYFYDDYSENCYYEIGDGIWKYDSNSIVLNINDIETNYEINFYEDTFELIKPLSREEAPNYNLNVVKLKYTYKKTNKY